MSTKNELQLMLKTFGYDLNPNTSKDSLVNLLHLHSKELMYRIMFNEMNPGHTRAIYQRQLLEAINNEINEDLEAKFDNNNEKFGTLSINSEDGMVTRSGKIIYHNCQ